MSAIAITDLLPQFSAQDTLELDRTLCTTSFYDFVREFWSVVVPERPVWNWHIEFLCDELQIVMERVFKRQPKLYDLIINQPPGSTKSTIASEMLPAWAWSRDATLRGIFTCYSFKPLAVYLSRQCRRIIQSDRYREMFPHVVLQGIADDVTSTTKGGQRITTSTGGTITGLHAHYIVNDDPLNPKQSVSKPLLKAANDFIDQTLMSRMVDRKITPYIMVMQRLAQDDCTGHLLESRGDTIRHICLPATLSDRVRPRSLRKFYIGGLFDARRLDVEVLERTKKELLEYAFAGQYLQTPIPSGGGAFRVDMLEIRSNILQTGWSRVVRFWDKAGTASRVACFTVGTKLCVDKDGKWGVLDVVRGQWEANERERTIRQTAEIDGRVVRIGIEQEPGSGGKESAQATIRRLAGFRVMADRPFGDKELRADPFACQVNAGNVWLAKGAWNRDFIEELRFFPFSKYKDQVDSASGAYAMLANTRRVVGGMSSIFKHNEARAR